MLSFNTTSSTFIVLLLLAHIMKECNVDAVGFTFEYFDNDDFDFANRMWLEEDSLFIQNIEAAATMWGDHIDSDEVLEVWISADTEVERTGGTFTFGRYVGLDDDGNEIFEPGPLSKILSGSNPGGSPDIIVNVNPFFVEEEYWFDPTPLDRANSKPPIGITDFVSIMLHEFGHGLGFAGERNPFPGPDYGTFSYGYVSTFDTFTSFRDSPSPWNSKGEPNLLSFSGTKASSVYFGRPVPLAHVGTGKVLSSQNFYHLGTCGSLPILTESLMNGCRVPDDGTILEIAPIDLAILEDLGYPINSADTPSSSASPTGFYLCRKTSSGWPSPLCYLFYSMLLFVFL